MIQTSHLALSAKPTEDYQSQHSTGAGMTRTEEVVKCHKTLFPPSLSREKQFPYADEQKQPFRIRTRSKGFPPVDARTRLSTRFRHRLNARPSAFSTPLGPPPPSLSFPSLECRGKCEHVRPRSRKIPSVAISRKNI